MKQQKKETNYSVSGGIKTTQRDGGTPLSAPRMPGSAPSKFSSTAAPRRVMRRDNNSVTGTHLLQRGGGGTTRPGFKQLHPKGLSTAAELISVKHPVAQSKEGRRESIKCYRLSCKHPSKCAKISKINKEESWKRKCGACRQFAF